MKHIKKHVIFLLVAAALAALINTDVKTTGRDIPKKLDMIKTITISKEDAPYDRAPHTIIKNRLTHAEIMMTTDEEPAISDIGSVRYEEGRAIIPVKKGLLAGPKGESHYTIKVPLDHMVRQVIIERS